MILSSQKAMLHINLIELIFKCTCQLIKKDRTYR